MPQGLPRVTFAGSLTRLRRELPPGLSHKKQRKESALVPQSLLRGKKRKTVGFPQKRLLLYEGTVIFTQYLRFLFTVFSEWQSLMFDQMSKLSLRVAKVKSLKFPFSFPYTAENHIHTSCKDLLLSRFQPQPLIGRLKSGTFLRYMRKTAPRFPSRGILP